MTVFQCDKCKKIMKEPVLKVSLCVTNKRVANKTYKREFCQDCAKIFCNDINVSYDNLDDLQEVEDERENS